MKYAVIFMIVNSLSLSKGLYGFLLKDPQDDTCKLKTVDGKCCVFPFVYNSVTYTECSTVRNEGVLWCSLDSNYTGSWGNCADLDFPREELLKKNNLIGILSLLETTYTISFNIKPTSYVARKWRNVLHLTTDGDGSRIPAIWFYDDQGMHVWCGSSFYFITPKIPLNTWTNIKVTQEQAFETYIFRLYINGENTNVVSNIATQSYKNVMVYASDPWYEQQFGSIKDLKIVNGFVDGLNLGIVRVVTKDLDFPREEVLKRDNLIGKLSLLETTYAISFNIKPTSYDAEILRNVLYLTTGEDRSQILALFFHGDTMKVLSESSFNFNTPKIPINTWTNIKITQEQAFGMYIFRLYINGENTNNVLNVATQSYKNVMVYASSRIYYQQSGSIKDLKIVNGFVNGLNLENIGFFTKDLDFPRDELLKKNNLIGILSLLETTYTISFNIKPTSYVARKWRNVLHLTTDGDGSRIPAIWFYDDQGMHVWCGSSVYFITPKIPLNTWTNIKISQYQISGIYTFRLDINGAIANSVSNVATQSYKNVRVFASDPWYSEQLGSIKDLKIVNGFNGKSNA